MPSDAPVMRTTRLGICIAPDFPRLSHRWPAFLTGFRREAREKAGVSHAPRRAMVSGGGVLEPYIEHGDQAQRSRRASPAAVGRMLVRKQASGAIIERRSGNARGQFETW